MNILNRLRYVYIAAKLKYKSNTESFKFTLICGFEHQQEPASGVEPS